MSIRIKRPCTVHIADRIDLKHHCGICGQLVVEAGNMKQHFRLSHMELFQAHAAQATKLCLRYGKPLSPCKHRPSNLKVPGQHLRKCTVLWHMCLLSLERSIQLRQPKGLDQSHLTTGKEGSRNAS